MAYRNVLVKSTPQGPIKKEWIMDATIQPGMLVEYADATRIQVKSATIDPTMHVVTEDFETSIDGTYASGDLIPFIVPAKGDEVICWGTSAAAATITAMDLLYPEGTGFLHIGTLTIGSNPPSARALETVVLVANTPQQLLVEVL